MVWVGRTFKGHLVQSHPSCAAPSPFPAAPLRPQRKEGDFSPFQNLSLGSLRLPAAAPGVEEAERARSPRFPLGLSSPGPGSARGLSKLNTEKR